MNRRLLWTFVLALLLPLAQVAAAAHQLSHAGPAAEAGSKKSHQASSCDLCAAAAAVTGGAAANSPPPAFDGGHPPALALGALPAAAPAPDFFAFLGRAPPSFPR